ncbi:extensin family protein [Enterobacteriaceae bacterium H20N1]|uniref:Extensin family protein n=1 Tax=Dryocola boscaweniae TaxID=2925397 RepID=A0A9X2W546_9ENTR|nr:extensin family protein [Dryocola boscaweniae]MCT4701079.1 extensin family protein [Dryocola boscaweniae]MCT4714533.1 extensin family protein [Dryocola boscaweniae]MCT4718123.1 extensin family protein [Dryocola boscaweniae]
MAKGVKTVIVLTVTAVAAFWIYERLPPQYNPFAPLSIDDPPTLVTRYKLRQMANHPEACLALLNQAQKREQLSFRSVADVGGKCPLNDVVRVQSFGDVKLSSSFLASCPLALSSTMFIHQRAVPQALATFGSKLTRVNHLGSYACRNIYNRQDARLSEHATADALDISGFGFANKQQITVLKGWDSDGQSGEYLRSVFENGCPFFGNALGPDYNAAHANHFHLGMRGYGLCR